MNTRQQLPRQLMYLIILILVLQVCKVVLEKMNFVASYYIGIIITSGQMVLVLGFIFIPLYRLVLRKLFSIRRTRSFAWLFFILQMTVLEVLFGYWLYHPSGIPGFLKPAYDYYYVHYKEHIIQFDGDASVYSSQLFYTLKPSVSYTFKNAEFETPVTTNRAGVRDDDSSLIHPAIICLGDSYAMGWGVQQSEAYPQLLEKATGKKVLNAGISSYGTAREILSLSRFDLSSLEYLVIQYCSNDDEENISFINNRYNLKVDSEGYYNRILRSHKINQRYFPGEHFLVTAQIFAKQQLNRIHPFFSLLKPSEDKIDTGFVKRFLDILGKAPVDLSKIKIIVFLLDQPNCMTSRFAELADSLRQAPAYQAIFGNRLKVIDCNRVLDKSDFYDLDLHIRPSGHIKVESLIRQQLQNF